MSPMTIHQRMTGIFTQAQVPGFLQEWKATEQYPKPPDIFATYSAPIERDALNADDCELIHRTDVYVHLYGKTDVTEAFDSIFLAAKQAGFYVTSSRDALDLGQGEYQYHRRLDLSYYDVLEG